MQPDRQAKGQIDRYRDGEGLNGGDSKDWAAVSLLIGVFPSAFYHNHKFSGGLSPLGNKMR